MIGAMKLQPVDGPRSCLGIELGLDDAMGPRLEFARRFVEGIGKLAGNMPGDHQKKTRRLITRIPEAVGLTRVELNWLTSGLVNISGCTATTQPRRLNRSYPGIWVLSTVDLPRPTGEPSVPKFFDYGWILAPVLKPIWGL
ncbi:hypothetical protein B296_00000783 [Ensete ventricosum]|uniref:Uncharacterized protein n=1 Tax=Ensete ventricosum TaxID=4639 RepID=A0A427A2V3_ENSVE|nr:hypothetical protein B296_00000783 [Ensete ventricosum]